MKNIIKQNKSIKYTISVYLFNNTDIYFKTNAGKTNLHNKSVGWQFLIIYVNKIKNI